MDTEQRDPQAVPKVGGAVPLTAVVDALKTGTVAHQAGAIMKLAQTKDGRKRLREAAPGAAQKLTDTNTAFLNAADDVEKHKLKVREEELAHHNKEQKLREQLTELQTRLTDLNVQWGGLLDLRKVEVETNDKADKKLRRHLGTAGTVLADARKFNAFVRAGIEAGVQNEANETQHQSQLASGEEKYNRLFAQTLDLTGQIERKTSHHQAEVQGLIDAKTIAEQNFDNLNANQTVMSNALAQAAAAIQAAQQLPLAPVAAPVAAPAVAGPSTGTVE